MSRGKPKTLKYEIESLDELGKSTKKLYTEKDRKYRLAIEGIPDTDKTKNNTKHDELTGKSHNHGYQSSRWPKRQSRATVYTPPVTRHATLKKTSTERIVAVLHDVMEDSKYTRAQLEAEGFSKTILDALDNLTKHNQEPYAEYIARVCSNPLATQIKLHDLQDNLDISRLPKITENDRARISKYIRAKNQILMAQRI